MIPRDPLALQCQLAGLASLEAAVRTALRALYATYPTLARPQSDDEAFEITTARMLADSCSEVLVGLDDHRAHVAQRLNGGHAHRDHRKRSIVIAWIVGW